MTNETVNNILAIYDDAIDKSKAINQLCGMFQIQKDDLKKVLKDNNRRIPVGRPTASVAVHKEEPKVEKDTEKVPAAAAVVPDYIKEVLEEKMDEIDAEIDRIEIQERELTAKKTQLETHRIDIHNFLNKSL